MLNLEIGTMLYALVAFIVLMLLVSRYALRPLLATMKQRADHIEGQIQAAEQNRLEAEKFLVEQKEALNQARQEAKEIIERAKAQKEREAQEIIKQAQERAEHLIQEATTEIEREKDKAIASLRDEVGALSVQLASKMLEQKMNEKEQSKLVDRYLEQVGRLQ